MNTKIKRGDRIFFKKEWQDKGDDQRTFIAVQDESEEDTIVVEAQLGMAINPQQRVKLYMLEGR